jgi:hypothetical protein
MLLDTVVCCSDDVKYFSTAIFLLLRLRTTRAAIQSVCKSRLTEEIVLLFVSLFNGCFPARLAIYRCVEAENGLEIMRNRGLL